MGSWQEPGGQFPRFIFNIWCSIWHTEPVGVQQRGGQGLTGHILANRAGTGVLVPRGLGLCGFFWESLSFVSGKESCDSFGSAAGGIPQRERGCAGLTWEVNPPAFVSPCPAMGSNSPGLIKSAAVSGSGSVALPKLVL